MPLNVVLIMVVEFYLSFHFSSFIAGQLRNLISDFLEQRFEQVIEDFEQLEPKDRIKVFTDLLQYSVPKLQAVSNLIEFEKMTDEQLDEVIKQLMQAHEQD